MLGINSFIKGCTLFTAYHDDDFTILKQFSHNPTVYTRLSCFLPWIAEQYGLTYTPSQPPDPECEQGVGDINEVSAKVCRTTPIQENDILNELEVACIFPYILNNKVYNECTLVEIDDFTRPQFICPIRTIKGRGTNYTTADVGTIRGYCPTNSIRPTNWEILSGSDENGYIFTGEGEVINDYNGMWELDPDNTWCLGQVFSESSPAFATCKNTCPGGKAPMVCHFTIRIILFLVNFPIVTGEAV